MFPKADFSKNTRKNDRDPVSLDLTDEIAMLRYAIRRVFACAKDEEQQDLITWGNVLTLLSNAANRLGRLLKTQRDLSGGEEDAVAAMLHQALKEINRDEKD